MHRTLLVALLALVLSACTPGIAQRPTQTTEPTTPAPPTSGVPIDAPQQPTEAASTPTQAPPLTATSDVAATLPTVPQNEDDARAEFATLAAAQRLPRNEVELARELGVCRADPASCPEVARTTPLDVQVGETRSFWVTNIATDRNFEINATLRYAGPVVLMYVADGIEYNQAALEQAAQTFEQTIYLRTRSLFGSEVQPGVDGDNRITILNAPDPSGGVLGYFSARDSVPNQINRYSNEREMFFMNAEALAFDDLEYLDVLSHEFQHMIHRNEQPNTTTWFNEGNSTLAQDLNGFVSSGYALTYLFNTDTQLTAWTDQPGASIAHYGAANLFMRYIYAQYAEDSDLLPLMRANAGNNLEAFTSLAQRSNPAIDSFDTLFADWAVANLVNDGAVGDGRYTYQTSRGLPDFLPATARIDRVDGEVSDTVNQFGVDYLELPPGTTTLAFAGDTSVELVGALPRDGHAWWSNRSDNSLATLTRSFDLSGVDAATLQFDTWYEIENNYDYAFVSVSTDGGETWQTLPGTLTTDDDPQGANYGNGITGVSGSTAEVSEGGEGTWVSETMDLTPYVGQDVLVRFWQINDEGFNAPGMLVDNISVPELNYRDDVEADASDWQAAGFVRVDGELAQDWRLRLVRTAADGAISVEPLATDAEGRASATLASGERATLVVTATTPSTTEAARYQLVVR